MSSFKTLPEGYAEIYSVDLQKDKKIAITVNLLAIIIAVISAVLMHFAVPVSSFFSASGNEISLLIRGIALVLSTLLYMFLHELVHGIAMRICGTKNIKYGFTGLYAFAGSNDYYSKKAYVFIALAPIVLLGAILAIINVLVPTEWFWVIYFIQITNISGAAGDLFVTVKFSQMPKDILVSDSGVGMKVYSRSQSPAQNKKDR